MTFGSIVGGNRVHVRIVGDKKDLDKKLRASEKEVKRFGSRITKSLKANAQAIKTGFALAAGAAVAGLVVKATKAASDSVEAQNALRKVFRESSEDIEAFGRVAADVAGLSEREFSELAAVTGALLQNLGFNLKDATEQTIVLTQRAADMASVYNTDVGTALQAINSGLQKQSRPLRQFAVFLDEASVKAKAVEMGLAATTAEVDNHANAQARVALIMEQSINTMGDFTQTTDDLANALRLAAARAENAAAKFGRAWTPVLASVTSFAADVLLSFQALGGDEIAQMELRISEAIRNIRRAAEEGGEPIDALADGLLHVARQGELTRGVFLALAAQAGLMPDQFEEFAEILLRMGNVGPCTRVEHLAADTQGNRFSLSCGTPRRTLPMGYLCRSHHRGPRRRVGA